MGGAPVIKVDSTRYNRRGFTLLEALFAIALLFAAIGTFLSLFPYALQKNAHDSYYLQGVAASQQYLDALRSAVESGQPQPPFPQIPIDAGYSVVDKSTKNQSPGNFGFSLGSGCTRTAPLSTLYYCSVTVTWPENGQVRWYTTESYATQQTQ